MVCLARPAVSNSEYSVHRACCKAREISRNSMKFHERKGRDWGLLKQTRQHAGFLPTGALAAAVKAACT